MAGRKSVKDPATGEWKIVPRKGPPSTDTVFRRLEETVGRSEIADLATLSQDERFQQLSNFLCDPAFKRHSLPTLAKMSGLSYALVLRMITTSRIEEGMLNMSAHVPQVMEDVAIDSKSKEVTCPNCEGAKKVAVTEVYTDEESKKSLLRQKLDDDGLPQWKRCLVCDGAGTLRQVGDKNARELLFDTLKLTGQRGPLVVQQFNQGQVAMEDTVASVREVLDVKVEKVEESNG